MKPISTSLASFTSSSLTLASEFACRTKYLFLAAAWATCFRRISFYRSVYGGGAGGRLLMTTLVAEVCFAFGATEIFSSYFFISFFTGTAGYSSFLLNCLPPFVGIPNMLYGAVENGGIDHDFIMV